MTARVFHPTSEEVAAHVRARHPRMVSITALARSVAGRPILGVTVTDPAARPADQQHVLVTAGQHGNEESGRLVAPALLDWLVKAAAAETRRRQRIVVLPNVNPDGAEADSHGTPAGVEPNLDHGPGGARTPEGRAVERMAERLQPELNVDLHARGYVGCSYDMVLCPWTRNYTEDDNLCHAIAADMAAAGARAGVPHSRPGTAARCADQIRMASSPGVPAASRMRPLLFAISGPVPTWPRSSSGRREGSLAKKPVVRGRRFERSGAYWASANAGADSLSWRSTAVIA